MQNLFHLEKEASLSYSVLNEDSLQTLIRLGLTIRQAKVYLALSQSGISTVETISKLSNIPRPDLYRIIAELQEVGLTEKIIGVPVRFKATPIQDGITLLLNRKIKETSEVQHEANELLKKFKETKAIIQEENDQFVLIPRKEVLAKRRKKAIETAQTSIHVVTTWKRYSLVMFTHKEELRKAAERGIQIHYVTEKPEDEKSLAHAKEIVQDFKKYPSFQVRYVHTPVTSVAVVFNKKEVIVITSPSLDLDESPALWSNNRSLIELAENYFEIMWNKPLEHKNEKH